MRLKLKVEILFIYLEIGKVKSQMAFLFCFCLLPYQLNIMFEIPFIKVATFLIQYKILILSLFIYFYIELGLEKVKEEKF